jgi:predicted Zn-dependent protease
MRRAFDEWEELSNDLIRFKFVKRPLEADITVEFVDFVTNCNNNRAVGCSRNITKGRNYYKALVTIGTKDTNIVLKDGQFSRQLTYRPVENIYGVMLHEIGHALGLGHSEEKESIMYPLDLPTLQYLTKSDLDLLYQKYH